MKALRFLNRPLDSTAKAGRAAREFAEMVGAVVNATVSQAPIALVEVLGQAETWYVAHVGADKEPAPLPLTNGHYLYLLNRLAVRRQERYIATLEYRYAYQATESDDSWIFRYEYIREPPEPYPYAKQHLHINATPRPIEGQSRSKACISRRVDASPSSDLCAI